MPGRVELIAYADRCGGSIRGLKTVLDGPLHGLFGGVHVLPFFTPYDGADAGFDPIEHTRVDPRLGTWADIAELGRDYDVMVDVIVNHVSSASPQFQDWLDRGPQSPYDGMFLTLDRVFPRGATEEDLLRLYRPRPGLPFTGYAAASGAKHLMWTTFTPQQIDLDVRHPVTREYLTGVLDTLAAAGVRRVRLDAVGYAVKTAGQSSFMTPDTVAFIDEVTAWCHRRNLEVLVEVHSYYKRQVDIAAEVDRVYDFALPPLVLHALTTGDAGPLLAWVRIRPSNTVTVLDTHDGIGVVDVGADTDGRSGAGLLSPAQIHDLVERIHDNSGGSSRLATGSAAANVDLYQVNCTYFDALGRNEDRYLLARALQLFLPGIPQVYYVGLFAGSNDMELLARSGVGRDVNRHCYTDAEIEQACARQVVRALFALIRLRNGHPGFAGECQISGSGSRLAVTWQHGAESATLSADVASAHAQLTWTTHGTTHRCTLADLRDQVGMREHSF